MCRSLRALGRGGLACAGLLAAFGAGPAQAEPRSNGVGRAAAPAPMPPSELARRKGCLACHGVEKGLVGPAFRDVARRYQGDNRAEDRLREKLRRGGGGAWGPLSMPPNPDLGEADARSLLQWVLGGAL